MAETLPGLAATSPVEPEGDSAGRQLALQPWEVLVLRLADLEKAARRGLPCLIPQSWLTHCSELLPALTFSISVLVCLETPTLTVISALICLKYILGDIGIIGYKSDISEASL